MKAILAPRGEKRGGVVGGGEGMGAIGNEATGDNVFLQRPGRGVKKKMEKKTAREKSVEWLDGRRKDKLRRGNRN